MGVNLQEEGEGTVMSSNRCEWYSADTRLKSGAWLEGGVAPSRNVIAHKRDFRLLDSSTINECSYPSKLPDSTMLWFMLWKVGITPPLALKESRVPSR